MFDIFSFNRIAAIIKCCLSNEISFKPRFLLSKIFVIFLVFSFAACKNKSRPNTNRTVYINYLNGRYTVYRNGKPFTLKGASGYTNLKKLKEAGGNTFRVWDTTNLGNILKEAQANNLAIIVGFYMPPNKNMNDFYGNPTKVARQYKSYLTLINKYKNHPSVLCWCLGNELDFPYKPSFNRFYKAFNNLIDMIHRVDPNHPVTTTMVNFQPKNILNIKFRTDIDFISFNIFGGIRTFSNELENFKWLWNGPFLITEWGIAGPWPGMEQTKWGAFIENTSTKKAQQYLSVYKQYMPVNNPRFLVSLVFYWGQKQEATSTKLLTIQQR